MVDIKFDTTNQSPLSFVRRGERGEVIYDVTIR